MNTDRPTQSIPNPGSKEAVDRGCLCPIRDNARGLGIYGGAKGKDGKPIFWINSECPMHGSGEKF